MFAPDGRELLTTQLDFAASEGSAEVSTSPAFSANYLAPDQHGRLQVLFNSGVEN